jgi:membrane protein DedA with SNARE-associated domain
MFDSLPQVNELLDSIFRYGPGWVYAAIWVACFVENVFPPFPGDTFILAGGVLVGLGRLDLAWVLVAANSGGLSSVMVLYYLGRRFGHSYFMRRDFRYFSADDVKKMEARLERSGALILMASRFILGLRAALAVAAGIGRYPVLRTAGFSLVSYLAFTGLVVFVGLKLVQHFDVIRRYFVTYINILWPILVILGLVWIVRRFLKLRKDRIEKRKGI